MSKFKVGDVLKSKNDNVATDRVSRWTIVGVTKNDYLVTYEDFKGYTRSVPYKLEIGHVENFSIKLTKLEKVIK